MAFNSGIEEGNEVAGVAFCGGNDLLKRVILSPLPRQLPLCAHTILPSSNLRSNPGKIVTNFEKYYLEIGDEVLHSGSLFH